MHNGVASPLKKLQSGSPQTYKMKLCRDQQ
jgi:hypothetical protein